MVEIQDPDNFTRFQMQERCALEIAAYVFKLSDVVFIMLINVKMPTISEDKTHAQLS